MLQIEVDYVVGVDTHRDEHVLAVVVASTGAVVAQRSVAATSRGYAQALRFADEHARGCSGVGGRGCGSLRCRACPSSQRPGETVLEAGRSPRGERRLQGKDDGLDATRAARTVLSSETLALPREGQRREALRLLMVARRSAVDVRRRGAGAAAQRDRDRTRPAPPELRGLPQTRLIERCSRLRRSSSRTPDELAATLVLRTLARRVQAATEEAAELQTEILAPRPGARTQAARRTRCRPDRRGPADRELVPQRPRPLRSSLRAARRRRPDPRLLRPDDPTPAQPRRRPPTQPSASHRDPPPPTARPRHQGLHRTTRRRRQNQPRRRPAPQALPRPPPPPRPQPGADHDLTVIGASFPNCECVGAPSGVVARVAPCSSFVTRFPNDPRLRVSFQ